MIFIKNREIETEGGTSELLTDASMILDFIYDVLEAELGHYTAKKILVKLLLVVFKRKRKERKCSIQKK